MFQCNKYELPEHIASIFRGSRITKLKYEKDNTIVFSTDDNTLHRVRFKDAAPENIKPSIATTITCSDTWEVDAMNLMTYTGSGEIATVVEDEGWVHDSIHIPSRIVDFCIDPISKSIAFYTFNTGSIQKSTLRHGTRIEFWNQPTTSTTVAISPEPVYVIKFIASTSQVSEQVLVVGTIAGTVYAKSVSGRNQQLSKLLSIDSTAPIIDVIHHCNETTNLVVVLSFHSPMRVYVGYYSDSLTSHIGLQESLSWYSIPIDATPSTSLHLEHITPQMLRYSIIVRESYCWGYIPSGWIDKRASANQLFESPSLHTQALPISDTSTTSLRWSWMGEGVIVRSTYGNKELRLEAQMISLHSEKILSHDMIFEVKEPITASNCIDNGVVLLSYGSSPAVYKVSFPVRKDHNLVQDYLEVGTKLASPEFLLEAIEYANNEDEAHVARLALARIYFIQGRYQAAGELCGELKTLHSNEFLRYCFPGSTITREYIGILSESTTNRLVLCFIEEGRIEGLLAYIKARRALMHQDIADFIRLIASSLELLTLALSLMMSVMPNTEKLLHMKDDVDEFVSFYWEFIPSEVVQNTLVTGGFYESALKYFTLTGDMIARLQIFLSIREYGLAMDLIESVASSDISVYILTGTSSLLVHTTQRFLQCARRGSLEQYLCSVVQAAIVYEDDMSAIDRGLVGDFLLSSVLELANTNVSVAMSCTYTAVHYIAKYDSIHASERLCECLLFLYETIDCVNDLLDTCHLRSICSGLGNYSRLVCIIDVLEGHCEDAIEELLIMNDEISLRVLNSIVDSKNVSFEKKLCCIRIYEALKILGYLSPQLNCRDFQPFLRSTPSEYAFSFSRDLLQELIVRTCEVEDCSVLRVNSLKVLDYLCAGIESLETKHEDIETARQLHSEEMAFIQKRTSVIAGDDECFICSLEALDHDVYLFPCSHAVHVECLSSHMKQYLPQHIANKADRLIDQLEAKPKVSAAVNSKAAWEREMIENQLHDTLASDCPLCGAIAHEKIYAPFITAQDAEEASSWSI